MKYIAFFLTVFSVLTFASDTNAQAFAISTTVDGDREIATLSFPAPSNQGWGVWEVKPRVSTAGQCLAATDFTSAVPADPNRVTLSHDPGTGIFYLRNSNDTGIADGCSILLVRSATDARDYVIWHKARYDVIGLADQLIQTEKETNAATTQRTRQTSFAVTFSTQTF